MENFLDNYQIQIKALGPVFIGSGKEYTKKEYLFIEGNKRLGILDMGKLYSLMVKKRLQDRFEDFMLNDSRADIRFFTKKNSVTEAELIPCMKYILECGAVDIERQMSILEFTKDPYGLPYIPGSSLKGMLRTVLLGSRFTDKRKDYELSRDSVKYALQQRPDRRILSREMKELESNTFNNLEYNKEKRSDAVNDELSGLIVSDSSPLEISDLILCQKVDRRPDGTKNKINILRESLKPGTVVSFQLTIDKSRLKLTSDEIMAAVEQFSKVYNEHFLSAYKGMKEAGKDVVYLGGGSGFVSKTVVYPLFGDEGVKITSDVFYKTNVPGNHGHIRDVELGVSPHMVKCTNWDGKLYQMGKCRISITKEE